MAKKIVIGLVVLLVVVAGGVYFLYSSLGPIIKAAIEKYGSEATQAKVTVDSVKLSASSGEGSISDLIIANPQGFSTPHAFELGSISLVVDTSTITKNPVVIKQVVIEAPKVTYEQGNSGGNLQKIQQNVMQYAGGSASAKSDTGTGAKSTPAPSASPSPQSPPAQSSSPSAPAPVAKGDERKLIIDSLDVRGGEVTVAATMLQGRTLKTPLPPLHLTDIGRKENGATPAEVTQRIIAALSDQAAKTAMADLQKNLGPAALEQLGKAGVDPSKVDTGKVGDQLKGLLGK